MDEIEHISPDEYTPRPPRTLSDVEKVEEIPVDFKAEFGKVRATTKTVLMELRSLSVEGEWAVVMSKARDYDLSVRKV